jgi:hypothetical protein
MVNEIRLNKETSFKKCCFYSFQGSGLCQKVLRRKKIVSNGKSSYLKKRNLIERNGEKKEKKPIEKRSKKEGS